MASQQPIQVPSNVSQIKTLPDVIRFLGAFAIEVSTKFNTMVSIRSVYGVVGVSGTVGITGSGNFSPSLISTGAYWIAFRESFFLAPTVVAAPTDVAVSVIWALQGVTNTGFRMNIATWSANANVNNAFHFIARGPK